MLTPISTRYSAMQLKCKYENFKQIKTEMSEYVWIYRLNQSHWHEKSSLPTHLESAWVKNTLEQVS